MKTLLLSLAGAFMALILFFLIVPVIVISLLVPSQEPKQPTAPIVLSLDMRNEYTDRTATDGLGALFGGVSFIDIITKLDAAATDPNVVGLTIRASETGIGSSRAEELRDAILKLKANDKFVIAHSQGFFLGGPSSYRAVSAADEIWMQQGSEFSVPGISLESLFFKGLLDKVGVTPEIMAFYEFKNAPNSFTQEGYTEDHALAMRALGTDLWNISLSDISADRADRFKGEPDMRTVLEDSPYSATQALELGLVDHLGWPEDIEREAESRSKGHIIDIGEYTAPAMGPDAQLIALVAGEGAIVTGTSGGDFANINAENKIASDTVSEQIYKAGDDPKIKAIIFRVDSPGGSPTASDQIWRAIEYVQSEKKKPVIISMGSVAASGGYYVSMGADKIVANRSTITGSIGVFGGRFAIAEGLAKIGVTSDSIDIGGPYSSTYTSVEPLTPVQREKMHTSLKNVYDRFVTLVADGRGMSWDDAHERARGRVWSGIAAKDQGLVDELGGLMRAVEVAREEAGIDPDAKVELRNIEPVPDPMEIFTTMFSGSESEARAMRFMGSMMSDKRISAALGQFQSMQGEPRQASISPIIER